MTILPLELGDIIDHTPLTNKTRFRFNFLYRELCPQGNHSRRQLLANAAIAASRVSAKPCVGVRSSWNPKANAHIHEDPTGDALALRMRPTTTPSASTSKSSSFHWPDSRLADARLRISRTVLRPESRS